MRRAVHLLLAAAATLPAQAQQRADLPASAAVRALTKEAQAEGQGDNSAVVLALDKRVRARWGDFESFPISVVRRPDLTIYLTTPYMAYRRAVIEHLRMREPLAGIAWVDAAVISVNPDRLEAPDITRLVVERDGKPVEPLKSLLRPMQFTNGSGDSASLHAGEIHFPMSAFATGAVVRITASPAAGEPFVFTLEDADLSRLK